MRPSRRNSWTHNQRSFLTALLSIVGDSTDIFVLIDGVKIARRGYPGAPQAKTWVTLEPGWQVLDISPNQLQVIYNGETARVLR